MTIQLVQELFQSCTSTDCSKKRLTFSPDHEDYPVNFLLNKESDQLEIIIFKSTVKKIFVRCHGLFERAIPFDCKLQDIPDDKIVELYYMTIGLMLITHENHTVINIHETILDHVLDGSVVSSTDGVLDPKTFLRNEIVILEVLLNSNNNRLNKSSSMWQLYKKLFIRTRVDVSEDALTGFIDTALVSCKLHPMNYYAWCFIKWVHNYSYIYKLDMLRGYIRSHTEKFCLRNSNDPAAWSCLVDVFVLNKSGVGLVCDEAKKVVELDEVLISDEELKEKYNFLVQWIIKNEVVSYTPYITLAKIIDNLYRADPNYIERSMSSIIDKMRLFEVELQSRGIRYEIHQGYHKVNRILDDDLLFNIKIQTHINWLRLFQWVSRFTNFKTNNSSGFDYTKR